MLVRPPERNDLFVKTREEGDRLIVDAEAVTPEGTFRNSLDVTVSLAAQGTAALSVPGRADSARPLSCHTQEAGDR